jgi:hypothetical protein
MPRGKRIWVNLNLLVAAAVIVLKEASVRVDKEAPPHMTELT